MSIAETVAAALAAEFSDEKSWGRGGERTHLWASGWRPCVRAMALDLIHPEDREQPDADGCARMAWGDEFEVGIRSRLERAGRRSEPRFTIEGAQEYFKLRDRKGRIAITGKIDGKIRFDGQRQAPPFEAKRGESVKRCRTLDDMLAGRWSAGYVRQMLAYLLGTGQPLGLMVLDTGAVPTILEVVLEEHLDLAEQFMLAAETAIDCKIDGAALPGYTENPEHCTRCDHRGKSCTPPWFSGDGPYISTSPELADLVTAVVAKEGVAKEYESARKRLQDLCRGKPLVLIGEHTITGKQWGKGWRMEIQGAQSDE